MMHFFNAYNVDSSCNYGSVGRMGIVGIAAIIDEKSSDFSNTSWLVEVHYWSPRTHQCTLMQPTGLMISEIIML